MMRIKLKQLEEIIEDLLIFRNPKLHLEQYNTPPHLAAHMLYHIQMVHGAIEEKIICDLGCGTGTLSIAASMLGASFVVGVDIDIDALNVFNENKRNLHIDNVDSILLDVNQPIISEKPFFNSKFDVVIMNPPFGTKDFQNVELAFLQLALNISTSSIYSLMISDHLQKIERYCKKKFIKVECMSEISYNLDRSYARHKKNSKDICVKLLHFKKEIKKPTK